ncbi:histidine kinase [Brooklawnia cerclae]|uniref:histidine kinase n=1 Tax=Brooklawnia cerclae TaxID=349934 RepID=A0ABX0SF89_9ACTN|nr:ATP-binding protein [Brooklawnia cerclae]NIH55431.1 signal transduction histidine kinase [Brooklawnia cerclae]
MPLELSTDEPLPRFTRWVGRTNVPVAFAANIGCYVAGLILVMQLAPDTEQQTNAWRLVTVSGLMGMQAMQLAWMRKQVVGTMIASLVMWQSAILVGGNDPLAVQPGVMFAVFTFATECAGPLRLALSLGGVPCTAAAMLAAEAMYGPIGKAVWTSPALIVQAVLIAVVTVGMPALLGVWYGQMRDRSERIAELAHHIIGGESARTAEAIAAERRTIAQEIHDTTSAHLAAMLALIIAAQATTLPLPQAKLIAQIRNEGERLYDGLQRVVTGMYQEDRTVATHYRGERQADQRSIAEIEALAAEHRATAHVPVTLDTDTDLDTIDERLGVFRSHIAYRVIQEALNNARKHASGAAITITVSDDGSSVLLRVENSGGGSSLNGPGTTRRGPSLGYGLPGMRDRLVAVGGSLRTGHLRNGGWSVNALLPHPVVRDQHLRPTTVRDSDPSAPHKHSPVTPPDVPQARTTGKKGVFA